MKRILLTSISMLLSVSVLMPLVALAQEQSGNSALSAANPNVPACVCTTKCLSAQLRNTECALCSTDAGLPQCVGLAAPAPVPTPIPIPASAPEPTPAPAALQMAMPAPMPRSTPVPPTIKNVNNETELRNAITAIDAMDTNVNIIMRANITLTSTLDTQNKTFAIDLNGNTLTTHDVSASDPGITINGGTLTIIEEAWGGEFVGVTSNMFVSAIVLDGGNFTLKSGTLRIDESHTMTLLQNKGAGSIEILGGEIIGGKGSAIRNAPSSTGSISISGNSTVVSGYSKISDGMIDVGNGSLTMTSGTIKSLETNDVTTGVINLASGTIDISGGNVIANAKEPALLLGINRPNSTGKAYISQADSAVPTVLFSKTDGSNPSATIKIAADFTGSVEISGGKIENTSNVDNNMAIRNPSPDAKVFIKGSGAVICANNFAVDKALDLTGLKGVVMGSKTSVDGTNVVRLSKTDINSDEKIKEYKYLEFVSGYAVNMQSDANGSVSATYDWALPGDQITISALANTGYEFKEWQVVSGGVTITNNSFAMPSSDVTIKAIFTQVSGNVPPVLYSFKQNENGTNGANGTWVSGSGTGFTTTVDASFNKFMNVLMDGQAVADEHIIKKSGSTIVTLKPEYLATLSAGTHTLRLLFTDGYAETTFTISAQPANPTPSENKVNPRTGVSANALAQSASKKSV